MAWDKDNSGLLGINDRKEKESHPDYKGSAVIDGVEYWVSGWSKENQYGPFISLAFQRKDTERNQKRSGAPMAKPFPTPRSVDPVSSTSRQGGQNFDLPFDEDVPF